MASQDHDQPSRRYRRVNTERAVLVRVARGAGPGDVSRLLTVSPGGCMFLWDNPLRQDTPLDLAILVGRRIAHARARVVYQVRRPEGCFETGAEFLETGAGDREILHSLAGASHA